MNSQQAAFDKLSNASEHMEGCQELVEPGTPTSVASSTRYKDLPTWPSEINEHECYATQPLQSSEQDDQVTNPRKNERDADELAKWIQSQAQDGLYEESEQTRKGNRAAHREESPRSRHKLRRSARIRQRELKTGICNGVRRSKRIKEMVERQK
ncbi:hypothetical protein PGQ11_007832 [Apiospora arundinis]|uniref:BZIP domain-containing protein n=1 Tax=Apiospora arundinis TaxID=335852 RepID=A0ABR2IWP7_9PEZI